MRNLQKGRRAENGPNGASVTKYLEWRDSHSLSQSSMDHSIRSSANASWSKLWPRSKLQCIMAE
jgi:hypothetical protein